MKWIEALRRRGNPIDWPETDRALFAAAISCVLFTFFTAISFAAQHIPVMAESANLHVLRFTFWFSIGVIVFWAGYCAVVWQVRKTTPDAHWPSLVLMYLIGQPLMVMAALNGVHAIITGLMLGALPVMGFILFGSRHVLIVITMIWAELILIGAAVGMGLLPDAPLYQKEKYDPSQSLLWLLMQVLIALPTITVMLLVVNALLNGLHTREQKILELSRRDGLTGVWNRRYVEELMAHNFAVARRSQTPVALLMVDLDHFKQINDVHGHHAGDKVLQAAAQMLQQSLRDIDHIGRYGGEEFVVLLPFCDADTALIIAERCRRALAALTVTVDERIIPVTASIGVSAQSGGIGPDSQHRMLVAADEALYAAKHAGRNRVVFAAPADTSTAGAA